MKTIFDIIVNLFQFVYNALNAILFALLAIIIICVKIFWALMPEKKTSSNQWLSYQEIKEKSKKETTIHQSIITQKFEGFILS